MTKVNTESLRSLAGKVPHNDCADYIDVLQKKIVGLEASLEVYKEESDVHERSTHIEDWVYEYGVNEKDEISCLVTIHGVEHTIGINEKVAKDLVHIFKVDRLRKNHKRKEDMQ